MTSHLDIARLRIETTGQVDPNLLVVALQHRLAGQTWTPGIENDVATKVQSAIDTHPPQEQS